MPMVKWKAELDVMDVWREVSVLAEDGDGSDNAAPFMLRVVERLKGLAQSRFLQTEEGEDDLRELEQIIECMESEASERMSFDEFDSLWDEFYDWADRARVWVRTTF